MEENSRSIFALDGITGMLIATVLLLSILAVLTVVGIGVQQAEAENFYKIENESKIGSGIMGANTSKQSDHIVDVK